MAVPCHRGGRRGQGPGLRRADLGKLCVVTAAMRASVRRRDSLALPPRIRRPPYESRRSPPRLLCSRSAASPCRARLRPRRAADGAARGHRERRRRRDEPDDAHPRGRREDARAHRGHDRSRASPRRASPTSRRASLSARRRCRATMARSRRWRSISSPSRCAARAKASDPFDLAPGSSMTNGAIQARVERSHGPRSSSPTKAASRRSRSTSDADRRHSAGRARRSQGRRGDRRPRQGEATTAPLRRARSRWGWMGWCRRCEGRICALPRPRAAGARGLFMSVARRVRRAERAQP